MVKMSVVTWLHAGPDEEIKCYSDIVAHDYYFTQY